MHELAGLPVSMDQLSNQFAQRRSAMDWRTMTGIGPSHNGVLGEKQGIFVQFFAPDHLAIASDKITYGFAIAKIPH
jgi:hypothetical protein